MSTLAQIALTGGSARGFKQFRAFIYDRKLVTCDLQPVTESQLWEPVKHTVRCSCHCSKINYMDCSNAGEKCILQV